MSLYQQRIASTRYFQVRPSTRTMVTHSRCVSDPCTKCAYRLICRVRLDMIHGMGPIMCEILYLRHRGRRGVKQLLLCHCSLGSSEFQWQELYCTCPILGLCDNRVCIYASDGDGNRQVNAQTKHYETRVRRAICTVCLLFCKGTSDLNCNLDVYPQVRNECLCYEQDCLQGLYSERCVWYCRSNRRSSRYRCHNRCESVSGRL